MIIMVTIQISSFIGTLQVRRYFLHFVFTGNANKLKLKLKLSIERAKPLHLSCVWAEKRRQIVNFARGSNTGKLKYPVNRQKIRTKALKRNQYGSANYS